MFSTTIRQIAPPVHPIEQDTEFVEGDTLLITEDGKGDVVTVGRVSVADYTHISPKAGRSVLYTLRYHSVSFPVITRSRIMSEKALLLLEPRHVVIGGAQ